MQNMDPIWTIQLRRALGGEPWILPLERLPLESLKYASIAATLGINMDWLTFVSRAGCHLALLGANLSNVQRSIDSASLGAQVNLILERASPPIGVQCRELFTIVFNNFHRGLESVSLYVTRVIGMSYSNLTKIFTPFPVNSPPPHSVSCLFGLAYISPPSSATSSSLWSRIVVCETVEWRLSLCSPISGLLQEAWCATALSVTPS